MEVVLNHPKEQKVVCGASYQSPRSSISHCAEGMLVGSFCKWAVNCRCSCERKQKMTSRALREPGLFLKTRRYRKLGVSGEMRNGATDYEKYHLPRGW